MTMMREKAVKDLSQYNAEMKELDRVIAHECNLKDFMTTKCSERSGQDDDHEMGAKQCKTSPLHCASYYCFVCMRNTLIATVIVVLSVVIITLVVKVQWGNPPIMSRCFEECPKHHFLQATHTQT